MDKIREKIISACHNKYVDALSHSSYICFDDKGYVTGDGDNQSCLSYITYSRKLPEYAFIFFGNDVIHNSYRGDKWCDWVINRSQYSDAFITKDVNNGFKNGFEINTKSNRMILNAGLIAIRHAFEFSNWSWGHFIELGFSEHESYCLSSNCKVVGKHLEAFIGNTNHLVIPPVEKFNLYEGCGFNCNNRELNCLSTLGWGCSSDRYSSEYLDLDNIKELEYFKRGSNSVFNSHEVDCVKFNKTNVEKILKYLKEI